MTVGLSCHSEFISESNMKEMLKRVQHDSLGFTSFRTCFGIYLFFNLINFYFHFLVPTRKRNKSGLPTECERAWNSPRPVDTFNVGNQAETLGDAFVHTKIV